MDKQLKIIKKKEHIIDALKRCLDRSVYSQVSLEDVAKEAGLSKGGLRHYFPTREELYIELIDNFFKQIEHDHIEVMRGLELDRSDRALVATLFGLEKFMMDKQNIKILINIILYGFEDEKIMSIIRGYIRNHLMLYEDIIRDVRGGAGEKDTRFIARITQIILLNAGLFESIDSVSMDAPGIIEFLLRLYRECN